MRVGAVVCLTLATVQVSKRFIVLIVTNCLANFVSAVTCPALGRNTTSIPLSRRRLPDEPKTYEHFEICAQTIKRSSSGRSQSNGIGNIDCIRGVAGGVGIIS